MRTIIPFLFITGIAVAAWAGIKTSDGPDFAIVSASYGSGDARIEAADLLRPLIAHGILLLQAPWGFGNPDPRPGVVKDVIIVYRHNGAKKTATFSQRQDILLPPVPKGLIIVTATYGLASHRLDVTEAVRAKVTGDTLSLPPRWSFGHVDPAAGKVKSVEITYVRDGTVKSATFSQGEKLELP